MSLRTVRTAHVPSTRRMLFSPQASSLSRLTQLRTLTLDFDNHAGSPARLGLAGLPDTLRSLTLSANNALMVASLPAGAPTQVRTLRVRLSCGR